jgi:hypothetical protein
MVEKCQPSDDTNWHGGYRRYRECPGMSAWIEKLTFLRLPWLSWAQPWASTKLNYLRYSYDFHLIHATTMYQHAIFDFCIAQSRIDLYFEFDRDSHRSPTASQKFHPDL